eukprot:3237548-Heterocapsa_arctica.AAC.1
MKAQTMKDNFMISCIRSKRDMEINPKHFIMNLKKKIAVDKSDDTMKYTTWLLFDTFQLTFGFNLDEAMYLAGRIYHKIKGLNSEGLNTEEGVRKKKLEESKA